MAFINCLRCASVLTLFLLLALVCCVQTGVPRYKRQVTTQRDIYNPKMVEFISLVGRSQVDLVVILDRSTGIGQELFYLQVMKLLKTLLFQYVLIHPSYARLAILSFGKDWSVNFDGVSDPSKAVHKARFLNDPAMFHSISFIKDEEVASGTNIKDALAKAVEILNTGYRNRGVRQVVLLVTDGDYGSGKEDPFGNARQVKELPQQPQVFAVGVGHWLKPGNVRTLASQNGYYGNYSEWKSLSDAFTVGDDIEANLPLWIEEPTGLCDPRCSQAETCFADAASGFYSCRCSPGYTISRDGTTCQACPVNQYKETYGDGACMPCPPDHETNGEATPSYGECRCTLSNPTLCSDPCLRNTTCSANEICIPRDDGSYRCDCAEKWTGPDCTTPEDKCEPSPCDHNGRCVNGRGSYLCVCPFSKEGRDCNIEINECREDLCVNNATCEDDNNRFRCRCLPNYDGLYCQDYKPPTPKPTPKPTSVPTQPPFTSNPTTIKTTVPLTTKRPTPAPTDTPTEVAKVPKEQDNLLITAVPAALGGALVLLIIVIVCILFRRSRRGRDEKRTPIAFVSENKDGVPSAPARRQPDLLPNMSGSLEAVNIVGEIMYDNTEIHIGGLGGWGAYLGELLKSGVVKKACVATIDSEKYAPTATYKFDPYEMQQLVEMMETQQEDVGLNVQGSEFFIFTNDGKMASGRTMASVVEPEAICVGATKLYIIVAISNKDDSATCQKEVEWIVEHIRGEGY